MSAESKTLIVINIILIFSIIGVVIWFIISFNNFKACKNNESPSCPSFYCGNIKTTGEPGTLCVKENGESTFKAYRYNKEGKLMCQGYTLPNNTVTTINYSGYEPPGPPTISN